MTDQTQDPIEQRAEQAFAEAFATHPELASPTRIDPTSIRSRARTRSRLKVGGTALAVLLIAGGIVGGAALFDDGVDSPKPVGVPEPNRAADDDPPPAGMRYDYFRDVRVTVPDDWPYQSEPGSDWCATGSPEPDRPYVSIGGSGITRAIACRSTDASNAGLDGPPTRLWTPHLTLEAFDAGFDETGAIEVAGWWVLRDRVGDVLVKAVSRDKAEAEQLLASAVVVEQTPGGCRPHGSVQDGPFPRPDPAFDVTAVADVDSIVVCQYTRLGNTEVTGLEATAVLSGPEADVVLAAIKAAPEGGGPNRPNRCGEDDAGEQAYELRLRTGDETKVMYVFYSTCRGNGFDDGTAKRELTAPACRPLMKPPVQIWTGSSGIVDLCWDFD